MKKRTKSQIITYGIIISIVILSFLVLNQKAPETPEELAKCIGKHSTLYTQLGCHACEAQKEAFGEKYQYLNVIDCFYEREKCEGITETPTWIINGEKYVRVQTIQRIKDLTGCEIKE
jgi:hypothetical protein